MIHYVLLGISIVLSAIGQLLLKTGADATGIIEQFLRPATIAGFGCYAIAATLYTFALRTIPLSVAFPSASAAYVLVVVLAHWMWREPLGLQQLAAVLLIAGGITLLHWRA